MNCTETESIVCGGCFVFVGNYNGTLRGEHLWQTKFEVSIIGGTVNIQLFVIDRIPAYLASVVFDKVERLLRFSAIANVYVRFGV